MHSGLTATLNKSRAARWARVMAGVACFGALAGLADPAAAAGIAQPAHGLIVQLRDAPSHDGMARMRAKAAGVIDAAAAEDMRWHRVGKASGLQALPSGGPQRRAIGRSAFNLDFQRVLSADEARTLAARLREQPEVEWVVPNEREQRLASQVVPGDPMYASQWWLHQVSGTDQNALESRLRGVPGLQRAWLQGIGGASVPVAVLDSGVTAHPELVGRLLPGYDLVSNPEVAADGDGRDADPSDPGDAITAVDRTTASFSSCATQDSSWHGTIVAGIIAAAANNDVGVAAVSWNGRVVPVRVAGKCGADVADIVDGMRWAAGLPVADGQGGFLPVNANPVRVINISFGGAAACNAAYQSTIDELWAMGVVVVAAAGNDAGAVRRPANCNHVLGVVALNRDGFKTSYSSFGPSARIATVGGDDATGAWGSLMTDGGLLSIYNQGRTAPGAGSYARLFGTSFATPVVAGTISLMLSLNPALTPTQIVTGLAASARPHVASPSIQACNLTNPGRCICTPATCGSGILDAEQALVYALAPDGYVAPARGADILANTDVARAAALGLDRPTQAAATTATTNATGSEASSAGGGGGAAGLETALALLAALALWLIRRSKK